MAQYSNTVSPRARRASVASAWRRRLGWVWLAVVGLMTASVQGQIFPPFVTAPANDNFANAQTIRGVAGRVSGSIAYATIETNEPTFLNYNGRVYFSYGSTVWYRWLAPSNGVVQFDTIDSYRVFQNQVALAVFTGTDLTNLVVVAADDSLVTTNVDATVDFSAIAGTTYYVRVDGFSDLYFYLNWNMPNNLIGVPAPPMGPNQLEFSAFTYSVLENTPGFAQIGVVYSGGALGSVSVDYATSDGTATNGLDYYSRSGTLVFDPGQSNKTLIVPIIDNAVVNPNKTILLALSNPVGATLGASSNAVLTIVDDEATLQTNQSGTFQFTTTQFRASEYEDDRWNFDSETITGIEITVTRTNGTMGRVLVDYYTTNNPALTNPAGLFGVRAAVPNRDYLPTSGTLIFDDFQTSTNFIVQVFPDGVSNGTAEVMLVLTNPRPSPEEDPAVIKPQLGAVSVSSLDIFEVMPATIPGVGFERFHYRYNETDGTVTVVLVNPSGAAGSVGLLYDPPWGPPNDAGSATAISGVDYTMPTDIITFAANQFYYFLTIPVNNDSLVEFNEDILMELAVLNPPQLPVNYNASLCQATILFDDQPSGALDRAWNPANVNFTTPPFNTVPGADDQVRAVVVQPDSKSVIGGEFRHVNTIPMNRLARFNMDGSLDLTFNPGTGADGFVQAIVQYPTDFQNQARVGQLIVAGGFISYNGSLRPSIARVNSDGSLDPTFAPGNGADGPIRFVSLRADGKILIGGQFFFFNDVFFNGVALLNDDGSIDPTFNPNLLLDGTIYAVAVEDPTNVNSRVYIGGDFQTVNTVTRRGIARLNSDGSLDLSFNPGGGVDQTVYSILMQPGGQLMIAGDFSTFDYRSRSGVARLNVDGSLDLTYYPGTGFDDAVFTMAPSPEGGVYFGGKFSSFNSTRRIGMARLMSNGLLDTTFLDTAYNQFAGVIRKFSFEPPNFINAIAVQPDGNVMIGGSFTNLGGNTFGHVYTRQQKQPRYNVARLIGTWGAGNPTQGPGNMEFKYPNYYANENIGTLSVTVQRSYGNLGVLESTGVPVGRTAVSNLDYVAQSVRLQTPVNGNPFPYLPVQIIDNTIPQSDRILDMILTDPWAGTILGGERILMGGALGVDHATVTIGDNDALHGVFNFSQVSYATNETARYAFITVIRTNGLSGSCTVDYYTQDGTAKNGLNYVSTRGTLSFGSDESSRTFVIQVLHNPVVEFDKTVVLVLTNATGGASLPGGTPLSSVTSSLTIYDSDFAPGRVSFSSAVFTNSELDGYGWVTVLRTGGSVGAIMAQFNTLDGTALSGVDYTAVTTNVYWADGDTTPRLVPVPLTLLNVVKGVRNVRLRLSNPSVAGLLGTLTNANLYILEPNSYGNLAFSQPLYVADENGGSIQVTVVRTDGSGGTVSVTAATVGGGTAVAGTDYVAVTTNLSFGPGVLAQTFSVAIIDNTLTDGDRTVKLGLSAPVFGGLGLLNTALLQIVDDESTHLPAGSLDASFNQDAQTDDAVYALALQADGRLLIAGDFVSVNAVTRKHLARLLPTGLLDPTFNADAGPNGPIRAMVLQTDNKILLGGSFTVVNGTNRNNIVRLNSDGGVDNFFNPGAGADTTVYAILVQPDNLILVGGAFSKFNGATRPGLTRLLTNGLTDVTFSVGSGADGPVYVLAQQADGNILVGGGFTNFNHVLSPRLVRLTRTGAVDSTFNVGSGLDAPVRALTVLPDGRIIVGGSFTNVNGVSRNYLTRLNVNGSVDTTYLAGVSAGNGAVYALAQQVDGRLLVGGDFTRFNGVTRNRITRLNPDGRTDPTINFGNGADNFVAALAIQSDRKIILGGGYTTYDGIPRQHLARIFGGSLAGAGGIEFGQSLFSVSETITNAVISVRRVGGTTGAVSNSFATLDGSALAGTDYQAVSGWLAFPEGEVRQSFIVPIINRTNEEGDRSLLLLLGGYSGGATSGPQPLATLRILDEQCQIQFSAPAYSVSEGDPSGHASIAVTRSGSTNSAVTVAFATTTNGSATAGVDYVATNGVVTFDPGQTSKYFTVAILGSTNQLDNLSVGLTLSNAAPPQFASVTNSDAVLVILTTNFGIGRIGFSATNYTCQEGDGYAYITVVRTNGTAGIVSVRYSTADGTATAGLDYVPTNNILSFAEGETIKTIAIPIIDDAIRETDETLLLTLSDPTGGVGLGPITNAVLTIYDNEPALPGYFVFTSPVFGAMESDPYALITVLRTNSRRGDVAVDFFTSDGTAVAGLNYSNTAGTLYFTNDQASATFQVLLLNDTLGNLDRTVNLTLSNPRLKSLPGTAPLIALSNAVLYITNEDSTIKFSTNNYYVSEGAGTATITAVRTGTTNGAIAVDYQSVPGGTAVDGLDYLGVQGRLSWASGDASPKTFTIPIIDNNVLNPSRTVLLILTNALGLSTYLESPSNTVLTIQDNDAVGPVAGGVDPTFNYLLGANDTVEAVFFDANQKLYVGGNFTNLHGLPISRVGRLNGDGTADLTFNPGRGADAAVYALGLSSNVVTVIQSTNLSTNTVLTSIITPAILIGGAFTNVDGQSHPGVARLGVDGAVDPTFNGAGGADGAVRALVQQWDGHIVIGGEFTHYQTNNRSHVARLNLNGTLDDTFVPPSVIDGAVYAVQSLTNGQVLIGGAFKSLDGVSLPSLARLNPDGSLDGFFGPAYGIEGVVRTIGVQTDGRILIGGDFVTVDGVPRNRVARLLANGTIDVTFDPADGADGAVLALQIQSSGQILVAGQFLSLNGNPFAHLGRFNPDGTVDTWFSVGAGADAPVQALALAPLFTAMNFGRNSSGGTNEDRMVVDSGSTNGVLTLAFSAFAAPSEVRVYYEGWKIYDSGLVLGAQAAVAVPYGQNLASNILGLSTVLTIVVNEGGGQPGAYWSYTASFAAGSSGGAAVALDNRIALGGKFLRFNGQPHPRVAELSTTGSFYPGFDPGAAANLAVATLGIYTNQTQPGVIGDIVAAGDFGALVGVSPVPYIGRLRPDGSFDRSFNVGAGPSGPVRAVAVQPDGKVVLGGVFTNVAGTARAYLARLNVDGSLDVNFNRGVGLNGGVNALSLQADGKVLIAGDFTTAYGVARAGVARLQADGSVDTTFTPGAGARGSVRALALQPDGKVVVGGDFTNMNNLACDHLARLNPNGTLDAGFSLTNGTDAGIETISLDAAGKILIGGRFTTTAAGSTFARMARLLPDGHVDATLNGGGAIGGANDTVKATVVDGAGQLLVGGAFSAFDGLGRNRLARLNSGDGSLDAGINFGTGADNIVNAVRLQGYDGKIVVGGAFSQFNGQVRWGVARVFGGANTDAGQFQVAASAYSVSEDGTNVTVTVVRAGGTAGAATVHVQTVAGTAQAGVDFTAVSTDLAFASAEITKTVTIAIRNNQTPNPGAPLQFTVVLSAPTGLATLGTPTQATVSILDSDMVVGFAGPTFTVAETDGAARITVVRQGGLDHTLYVDYATTTNGTALAGVDYVPVTATLVFNPGVSVRTFSVPVLNDNVPEFDETVGLVLSKPGSDTAGAVGLGQSNAVLTIVDRNSSPGVFSLSSTNYVVSETAGAVAVTVLRTNGHSGTVWVHFNTVNGSARAPLDYLGTNGVVVFADGEVARTILVPIVLNPVYEGDRSFFFQLTGPGGGASLSTLSNAVVTILEDQSQPSAIHMGVTNQTVRLSVGIASVLVVRSNNLAAPVQVDFFTVDGDGRAGVDYVGTNGTLTLDVQDASKAIGIGLINDGLVHSNRSFRVVLTNAFPSSNAVLASPVETTVTILNDNTTIGFSTNAFVVDEANTNFNVTVWRLGQTNQILTVFYATYPGSALPGQNYVPTNGMLSFQPGETVLTFPIRIFDDGLANGDKTVYLTLSNLIGNATLSVNSAILTIRETDFLPGTLVFSAPAYAVGELATNAVLTVLRTNGSSGTVSVDFSTAPGTATPGLDYIPVRGTLSFADGETNKSILVPVLADSLVEGLETFTLSLVNPLGGALVAAPATVTVTIIDANVGAGSVASDFDVGAGADGLVRTVAVQPDGRIVSGGAFSTLNGQALSHLARVNGDGSVDSSFLPVGYRTNFYARYTNGGVVLTNAIVTNAIAQGTDGLVWSVRVQGSDNRIVLGGSFTTFTNLITTNGVFVTTNQLRISTNGHVVRLNPDGMVDTNFVVANVPNAGVNAVALEGDTGKVLLGGSFSSPLSGVLRLQRTGSLDTSFDPGAGANNSVYAVCWQANGQVVIGGAFTTVNGLARSRVARLGSNGVVDLFFNKATNVDGAVYAVAVQPDGCVILGGAFTNVNGVPRPHLARLKPDGSLDRTFFEGGQANGTVFALALQADGRVLLGGDFTTLNGLSRSRIARVRADGTLDTSFDPGRGADGTVFALGLLPDQRIVVGGDFASISGWPRRGLAVLLNDVIPFINFARQGGAFRVTVPSAPLAHYVLWGSADLKNWHAVSTTQATGPTCDVWDLQPPLPTDAPPYRFYRVRSF